MPNLDETLLYAALGRRVRTLRKQSNLSQDDLASRLGLLRTSITNIESGRQKLTLASLYRLSAAFNISFDDLLPPRDQFIKQDPIQGFNPDDMKSKNESVINRYMENTDE
ncbi:helix-turn-helix domain-containing protein [uncultured Deinococcus sp.]|uniref:helix-turn-helix domain-containing protein n=1 Tax=uncultured Deinococcus sp. TaxID=158789 RepID=UPI00345B6F16